jgi:hypothetical protein
LDSWLEALARRLTMPACDLLPALGLDVGPARSRTTAFATHLCAGEIVRLAAATGTPSQRIPAMTLTAYKSVVDVAGRRYRCWADRAARVDAAAGILVLPVLPG